MMETVRNNQGQQILLFDDGEAAQEFIAQHNKGAAIPAYTRKGKVNSEDLGEVFKVLANRGLYIPVPAETLWKRAAAYHEQKKDLVSDCFSASGLTEEEKNAVSIDYFNGLMGNYNYSATPLIMHSVINKVEPFKAYFIDKYGLWQMFQQYSQYCGIVFDFADLIKGADNDKKTKFLDDTKDQDDRIRAFVWALANRYIRLLDFSGIPTETLLDYTNKFRQFSELFDYGHFYHLSKYAYLATPEELQSIRPPKYLTDGEKPLLDAEHLKRFAVGYCADEEEKLKIQAEQYATIIDRDTPPQEQEKNREQAARWSREISLPVNYNRISQRPIEVSTSEQVTVTTSLRDYINGWLQLPTNARFNKDGVTINDYTIQQVIGGLSLLKADNPQVKPVNGLLTYKLNISEFAEYCQYKDANSYVKEAFLGGLMLLSGLYLIVDRPVRIRKKQNGTGVYKTGGKSAINLIRLRQYDTDKDDNITNLVIDIVAGNLGGTLKPLGLDDLKRLTAEAKGLFVSRFNAIIVGMDNKKEEAIMDDCAGYSDMLAHAETEDDKKATREYIRKKKPAHRKKVQALFERYKQLGFLKDYKREQNKAGEWVYRWQRGTASPVETEQPDLFSETKTGKKQPKNA